MPTRRPAAAAGPDADQIAERNAIDQREQRHPGQAREVGALAHADQRDHQHEHHRADRRADEDEDQQDRQHASDASAWAHPACCVHLPSSFSPSRINCRGLGALARAAARGRDGGGGLRLTIAEIDQRRDGVGDRLRRAPFFDRAGEPHHRRIEIGIGRRLVLQFGDDALGDLRPDAGRARDHRLVAHGDGGGEIGRRQRRRAPTARPWCRRPARSAAAGTIRARRRRGSRTGGSGPRAHGSRSRASPARPAPAAPAACAPSSAPDSRRR